MLSTTFSKIDRICKEIEEWSIVVTVTIALVTAMANVILRKTTSDLSLYWSDEVVRKGIFFLTYIGAVAAIRTGATIRIDALPQVFPSLKRPLMIFSHLVVLGFSAIMVYLGTQMTIMMYKDEFARTATLQIPEYLFYAVLPLMGIMMFFRTLLAMGEDWTVKRGPMLQEKIADDTDSEGGL